MELNGLRKSCAIMEKNLSFVALISSSSEFFFLILSLVKDNCF